MSAPLPPFTALDPGFHRDPYPVYARYRERDPVHWSGPPDHRGPGAWYLFRHADVMAALKNPSFVRNRLLLPPDPLGGMLAKWMLFRNPPDHTRLRALAGKAFTRHMAERLEPAIQHTANFLLDGVAADGEMDLMVHYASPLPLITIAELLGLPREDRDQLRRWTTDMVSAIDVGPTEAALRLANAAALELLQYLETIVAERRRQPADDLITALIAAEEQGDELTGDELLSMCVLLMGAGHETTVNLIGNGTLALLRHVEQWARFRSDPACTDRAVDELLRFDSPVQMAFREASDDVAFAGQTIRRGESVVALLGAANRDPEVFPDPDRLDITRPANRHAAFGNGIHYCLGSNLARLEGRIAFRTLAERLPNLHFIPKPVLRREGITFRGLHTFPLGF